MKWWKARSRQEKWMIVIIVMLVIGIILRWDYVRKEAGDAFRWRVDQTKTEQPAENTGNDSGSVDHEPSGNDSK